ncbi:sigma factor regulator FemR [Tistrella bauzanensis]|uniref:Sigma factor regulator FemR n=1 Tax=Tistrella bauzanensis TaxID=657419 RepID=A0ABQ1ICN8_9PROT|nr:FecR domain-containing protein [Tistrella bauzanensis]GGB33192.1 sigma factor regulator FemR [Tistrella bauzanensis]
MTDDSAHDREQAEALKWFLLMKEEPVAHADRDAFARWLAGHERRADAYARAEALWARFDAVKPSYDAMAGGRMSDGRRSDGRRISRRAVLTGGAVLVAGAAGSQLVSPARLLADATTGVAERRMLTLPDGSRVELASRSALSIRYTGQRRAVTLHDGEGWFQPMPDPRPFVARTAQGLVATTRAGFDLRARARASTVYAIDGEITVMPDMAAPFTVAPRQDVRFTDQGMQRALRRTPEDVLAWRHDRIVFEDVPLAEVLDDLGRHRHGPILLADRRAAALTVTAVFDLTDIDRALAIIGETLPVRMYRMAGLVVVRSA